MSFCPRILAYLVIPSLDSCDKKLEITLLYTNEIYRIKPASIGGGIPHYVLSINVPND